jgi:ferredoxin
MSSQPDTARTSRAGGAERATRRAAEPQLRVDRVACTGHGVCGQLLAGRVRLDDLGYPILDEPRVGREDGDRAITFCPARALYWSDRP